MKLSVLTFSKDNQDLLFNLIKNVEDIASEIIIIDSSSQDVYLELKNKLKKIER